jgi:hypothetical protein
VESEDKQTETAATSSTALGRLTHLEHVAGAGSAWCFGERLKELPDKTSPEQEARQTWIGDRLLTQWYVDQALGC